MRNRTLRAIVVTTALSAAAMLALAMPASAHEGRDVGDHEFVVGFGTEPAIAGYPNSVQLMLLHHDGEPVTKIEGKLGAEVAFGDQAKELELEPHFEVGEFGEPGDYRAWFIPTRPGEYTFRIFGTLEGEKVDEAFTSGPETFSEVANPTSEGFPVGDPTTGELAERIAREVPRLNDEIAAATNEAEDAASSARSLAIAALTVGAVGVIVGAFGLVSARKRS